MTKQMAELMNKRKELIARGDILASDESKFNELTDVSKEIETLNLKIETLQGYETSQKNNVVDEINAPQTELFANNIVGAEKPKKQFDNLGEQLRCIMLAGKKHIVDERLNTLNAIQGANETTGADGAFALQSDFASDIFDSVIEKSPILSQVSIHDVSSPSNSVTFYTSNEDDAANGVYGGLKVQWADEGGTVDKSQLKLKRMKIDLGKMMGFAFVTEEMLQDAAFMGSYIEEGLMLGVDDLLVSTIINGDGVDKPLGVLKSDALIKVAKENGQSEMLTPENLLKLRARILPKSQQNAVFAMHPDFQEFLPLMKLGIGQGGVPVYLPQTGLAGIQYDTLFGKPIVYDQNCSPMGKAGDIIYADWSKYLMIKKGAVRKDWSMHVEFLTDQSCFRIVFRANGAPKYEKPIKIKNSDKTRSPFITLDSRV